LSHEIKKDLDFEVFHEPILEKSLMEKLICISKNTIFMERYMTSASALIMEEMLLLNEYRQQKKEPVLTHSLAYPHWREK